MPRQWLKYTLIVLLVSLLAACGGPEAQSTAPPSSDGGESQAEPAPEEQAEESPAAQEIDPSALFAANCARCHGADRSGGRGPALLPERLTKDAAVYQNTITNGSEPMPSFGSRFSTDEINALVEFILSDPQ